MTKVNLTRNTFAEGAGIQFLIIIAQVYHIPLCIYFWNNYIGQNIWSWHFILCNPWSINTTMHSTHIKQRNAPQLRDKDREFSSSSVVLLENQKGFFEYKYVTQNLMKRSDLGLYFKRTEKWSQGINHLLLSWSREEPLLKGKQTHSSL